MAKVRDYIELCKQNVAKFIFSEINRVFACFFVVDKGHVVMDYPVRWGVQKCA